MWLEEKIFAGPIFRVSNLWVYLFFSKSFQSFFLFAECKSGRFSISLTAIWSSDKDLEAPSAIALSQEWLLVGMGSYE